MKELKLDELARKSGVPARTIRLYITRGLIPGPLRSGRKAAYGPEHVAALAEIRHLQKQGLTLAEIRQRRLGEADFSKLPALVRWSSYAVAPDVVVMVREDVGGWRLRQVRNAVGALSECLMNGTKKADGHDS